MAGEVRAALEKQGTPLAFADLQMAGIALANNITLVSGNEKHFGRIPRLYFED